MTLLEGLYLAPTQPTPMRYSGLITRPTEGVKLLPVIEIIQDPIWVGSARVL
jgi:hypothetical protein